MGQIDLKRLVEDCSILLAFFKRFLSVFLDQKEKRECYVTVFSCLPLLNPLLLDSTLTLRCPIPASGGKMCDNSCSALSGRTIPFGLVCVQPCLVVT